MRNVQDMQVLCRRRYILYLCAWISCAILVGCSLAFADTIKQTLPALEQVFKDTRIRALIQAAAQGKRESLQQLIANGVDLHAKGEGGLTPLHWLVLSHNSEGTKALLAMGASPNIQDDRGTTPLWLAAAAGYDTLSFILITHRANPDGIGPGGLTPLMIAAANGNRDVVLVLIRAGAKLDRQDGAGNTALIYGVKSGKADMVQSLLEAGADRFVQNGRGLTAMSYARLFQEQGKAKTADTLAALLRVQARDVYLDEDLQKIGAAIEAHDPAPLKQLLVNPKIDLNTAGLGGMTLLAWSILQKNHVAFDALLSRGANPAQGDDAGTSALHLAAEHHDSRYLQAALAQKPDLAIRNDAGWTPLTAAILAGRQQNALLLVQRDEYPNMQDNLGLSPLHHAVLVQSDVIMIALLQHGADRTLTDDEGLTALDYAHALNAKQLINLLIGK